MRVTSVDLYPSGSANHINLSYLDPGSSNTYNVKLIEGLDPNSVIPRYYASGGSGDQYYDLSLQPKDVGILVSLNPHFGGVDSYSSLRDDLYRLIASSRTGLIQLRFNNGDVCVAAVSGFITKIEAPLFDQKAEVKITISCEDPMLRALVPTYVDVSHLDDVNPTITDSVSTAPHGLEIEFSFTSATPSMYIRDPNGQWTFTVTPATLGGFQSGDNLFISSNYNDRALYLIRSGARHFLADSIFPNSVWPILFPGANHFHCSSRMNWEAVAYFPTYWGV